MLRITRIDVHTGEPGWTLKLEGKLVGPWVDELSRTFEAFPPTASGRLGLDLSDVTFIDSAGAKLLKLLIQEGVTIVACSGFVALLLDGKERSAIEYNPQHSS